MKSKITIVFIFIFTLFLCSCIDDTGNQNYVDDFANDFGLTKEEIEEGKQHYANLEAEIATFKKHMEDADKIQMDIDTYVGILNNSSTEHLTIKASNSLKSIVLEQSDQPLLMINEEENQLYSYVFDIEREGYYKKRISEDDLSSLLENSGLKEDELPQIDLDPSLAKIRYDGTYIIELYGKDILQDDFIQFLTTLGFSRKTIKETIFKYIITFKENRMEITLIFQISGYNTTLNQKATYNIIFDYAYSFGENVELIDLSKYQKLIPTSPEYVDDFTSIDTSISSSSKGNNDTYKIKLSPGIYTIANPNNLSLFFLNEELDYFTTYTINEETEFLIIEEDVVLYMQVMQYSGEGYSLTFTKQSDKVKNKDTLPDRIQETLDYKFDYVIFDTSNYDQNYMTLQNNLDSEVWIFGSQIRLEENEIESFYYNNPYLLIVNNDEVKKNIDLNVYVPKNYGKLDITNGTEEYYLVGAQGFEATFTFQLKQTGYFQIELVDQENQIINPRCRYLSGYRDTNTFHGFDVGSYELKLSDIMLDEPGFYKIRIKMME